MVKMQNVFAFKEVTRTVISLSFSTQVGFFEHSTGTINLQFSARAPSLPFFRGLQNENSHAEIKSGRTMVFSLTTVTENGEIRSPFDNSQPLCFAILLLALSKS